MLTLRQFIVSWLTATEKWIACVKYYYYYYSRILQNLTESQNDFASSRQNLKMIIPFLVSKSLSLSREREPCDARIETKINLSDCTYLTFVSITRTISTAARKERIHLSYLFWTFLSLFYPFRFGTSEEACWRAQRWRKFSLVNWTAKERKRERKV